MYRIILPASTITIGYILINNPIMTYIENMKHFFDNATFNTKVSIFESLPKLDSSQINGFISLSNDVREWDIQVLNMIEKFDNSKIYNVYNYMKNNIENELTHKSLLDKVITYKKIYPDSFELKYKLLSLLDTEKYIDSKILIQTEDLKVNDLKTIELVGLKYLILSYPNKDNLISFIKEILSDTIILIDDIENDTSRKLILNKLHSLSTDIKNKLIQEIIYEIIITMDDNTIIEILNKFIVNSSLLNEHKINIIKIFSKLSPIMKSKIILNLIYFDINKDETQLLTNLIQDTGIVIIKLGQFLSDNKDFRLKYSSVLLHTLTNNNIDNIIDFWKNIPITLRHDIKSISHCKGSGSIKQIHKIIDTHNNIKLIASIKSNVLNDTVELLNALDEIKKIKNTVVNIGDLIYNELNLYQEYKSFEELRKNKHILNIDLPEVFYPTPNTMIRTFIDGSTLNNTIITDDIKNKLDKFHQGLITMLFDKNLILSDIHLGNIILSNDNLYLIDPAQLTHIKSAELNILSWILITITTDKNIDKYFKLLIEKLLRYNLKHKYNDSECKKIISDLSYMKNELKNIKNKKYRMLYLLNNLTSSNVIIPTSIFAFSKQYDGIQSQREQLHMSDIDIYIQEHIKHHLSWFDYFDYIYCQVK